MSQTHLPKSCGESLITGFCKRLRCPMMPSVGFGVFQIPVNETERFVTDALEAGYQMIDTAASYFNEEQVGNALRHSGLKREDVFVTTKLWVQDYEYDDALRAFDLSMKKLGLDYLDLYLLHKPYGNYYAVWRAAERLYREGRIRAIGVTSFSSERLQDLFLHNEEEGIQHEAWAPFAEGQNDIWNNPVLKAIAGLDTGRSPIYDDMDLQTVRGIGTYKIHE